MFPEKYKHPSRQQKTLIRRVADKTVSLFKRDTVSVEATGWIV